MNINRRDWIKKSGLITGASLGAPAFLRSISQQENKPVMRIAHITDVHIRPESGIPDRAIKCLEEIKEFDIDFFLNGGDSIQDASYDDVKRLRVMEQWEIWDQFREHIKDYDVYSCLGNHDMWWAAPSKNDDMYGKEYAVDRLNIPSRYYSFDRGGWHFIILDGNNKGISLDKEQWTWLEKDLDSVRESTPVLIMSHYPILGVTGHFVGGQYTDFEKFKSLFYKHRNKVKLCLSGHQHMLDTAWYNGVSYFCNGALSGFWWGDGNENSAGKGYYLETPPGFTIIELYKDGRFNNQYHPHTN